MNNRATNLSSWVGLSNETIDIDKVFIENPEFQKYFFQKAKISKDDPNYAKARAIGLLMLDYAESSLATVDYLHKHLPEVIVDKEAWETYFTNVFHSSPLLCDLYAENKSGFGKMLRRFADAACDVH